MDARYNIYKITVQMIGKSFTRDNVAVFVRIAQLGAGRGLPRELINQTPPTSRPRGRGLEILHLPGVELLLALANYPTHFISEMTPFFS